MDFILRKWKYEDAYTLVKHANNINVSRYLTNQFPYPYVLKDAEDYIRSIENDNPVKVFAIDIEGEPVGSIGIFPQSDIHEKNAEIGYWLSETYWGKGIISEAIKRITQYGFETFDIERIFARPFSINTGSVKALQKAGLLLEASFPKALYKNGKFYDEVYYSTTRDVLGKM